MKKSEKEWEIVFKVFANINRIKIVKILLKNDRTSVSNIAEKLNISPNATSKHLIMMKQVGVLESEGTENRVYYFMSENIPKKFSKIINFLKNT